MANLNDVLQGLVNINSKMAKNINTLFDSIGEGFLDVGELVVKNDMLSLKGFTILVNGSNLVIENMSNTFTGNKICFLEYKADKSIVLKVLPVVDANFNYDLSQLDATSKHFEIARQYNGVLEDRRMTSMASKDNTIVSALNGALKAIDYNDVMNLEINMDILSRISTVESNVQALDIKKADKTYVDKAVANVDIDGVVKAVNTGVVEDIEVTYVTRKEFDDALSELDDALSELDVDLTPYQEKSDKNLSTTNKTIVGAINELFQSANNGKQLIADAIGNNLITVNSTFSAMSEAILGLRRRTENESDAREVLYNMMLEDGYNEATTSMTIDELIELLDGSNIQVEDISQIACGTNHTFVLKNDGSLWSCGRNDNGQLGLGNTTDRYTFTQVTTNIKNDVKQIACGNSHTFIIKNDGSVWSCGYNYNGQLGLNDTTKRTTFIKVTTNINNDVKQIACGIGNTFILKNDGSLWACGYNEYGQLGLGNTTRITTFTQVTANINNDVKQIACGTNHTFVLKNDGSVWSCGSNSNGQLGLNDTTDRYTFTQVTSINNDVKQIICGGYHNFILKNDGSIWSCGYNEYGQLGLGNTTQKTTFTQVTTNVKQIACGLYHTIIIKNDGSVWTCGYNIYGNLGLNDTNNRTTFTEIIINIKNDVKQVSCGSNYTIIIKNDGTIWGCGLNGYGQLGLGDNTNKTIFVQTNINTGFTPISDYEISRLKLYYYLLNNEISTTEDMDIGSMLDLLVGDYINKLLIGYESNLRIILSDEGVNITEEDDMASLINKVDEEFDNALKHASGTYTPTSKVSSVTVPINLSFTPTYFVVNITGIGSGSLGDFESLNNESIALSTDCPNNDWYLIYTDEPGYKRQGTLRLIYNARNFSISGGDTTFRYFNTSTVFTWHAFG